MRNHGVAAAAVAVLTLFVLYPEPAAASQVTFVVGAVIGDGLADVAQVGGGSLREDFDNAPIYGARLGWSAYPFAVEGSLVLSPSAVNVVGGQGFDARLVYAEADLQLYLFPGPISPFVGGGIGLHNIKLDVAGDPAETVRGYVFGGGIKAGLGAVGLRLDLRDHITPLKADEVDADFLEALGIAGDKTLHNVELSAGLSIRF